MSTDVLSERPDRRRAVRRTWPILRAHRLPLASAAAISILATVAELGLPVFTGRAIDAVVDGDRSELRLAALFAMGLAVARLVLDQLRRRLAAIAAERFLHDLRVRLVERLMAHRLDFFDQHRPGELLARATGDVAALAMFVREGLLNLAAAGLLFVIGVMVLAGTSWELALVTLVYVPGAVVAIRRFRREAGPTYAVEAQSASNSSVAAVEGVTGRDTLQSLDADQRWQQRFDTIDDALVDATSATLLADNRLSVLGFWQLLSTAAVLVAGGSLARAGRVSVGEVATFVLTLRQLFAPVESVTSLYGEAEVAGTNLARILQLVEQPFDDDRLTPVDATSTRPRGQLELTNVSYAYADGTLALDDVSLTVAAGEHIALVGSTGAGKSTLAKVASGLLLPTRGTVTLAGQDVHLLGDDNLRRRIVLLPQESHVLAGTLADNLRLVPGAHSETDIEAALHRAGLEPWVRSLPNGIDTWLGERGANLSAGERQLVALGRAALAEPDVLILDEATADVDPVTEALVARSLQQVSDHRTLIVIAHRPATAARYPRIVQVEGGRIVS